jgi:hypothetical protein
MLQPFRVSVDFKQKKSIIEPVVTQLDDLTFVVTVFDNGEPAVIDGSSYRFVSRREDDKTFYADGVKTGDNEITFDLGRPEVSLVGNVKAAIQIFNADMERLSSFTFNYTVVEDISIAGVVTDNDQTLLEMVIQEGPGLVDYFTQAKPLVEQYTNYVDDLTAVQSQVSQHDTQIRDNTLQLGENTKQLNGINNVKEYDVVGDGIVGDSDKLQAMVDTVRANIISLGLKQFYTIDIPSGTYIIDKQVKVSPYIKFRSTGIVIFKLTFNGTAFWISPTEGDPTFAQSGNTYYLNKNIWNRGDYFDGSNGGFIFTTELDKNTTGNNTVAIEFGDRNASSNAFTPVSRYTINNVNVFALNAAFKWNGVNHYIGTYKHCHLEGNNHALWSVSMYSGNSQNAGENFIFDNCIIAQSKQEAFLLECGGHDISFNNCSFDFNVSPVIRSKYSGICLRVNNCYLEMIGDGTGDELFYQAENTIAGSDYRRNSLYTKNFIMYINRPSQIIKNVANAGGTFINLFLDLEIELRYQEADVTYPYNLQDRFLVDTAQNITLFKHRIVNANLRRNLVCKDLNLLSNGDFSKSALNADLTVSGSDPYWFIGYKSATSNPTVVAEGIGGSNCLKWTINTAGNNSIQLNGLYKIPVEAGEQLFFSSLFRTDKIDNNCQFIYRFEFYDANNTLLSTSNYYDFVTGLSGVQTIDSTQFRLSRSFGIAQVPPGATQVKPILIPANHQGTTMWLDDIHFSKSK